MSLLRSHWGFFILVAVVAPLAVAFAAGHGIASVGDDSVSYLTLALHYSGQAGQLLEPWVSRQAHFAPLFPLALAAAGGASDLAVAHAVVAGFAILATAGVYLYGRQLSGREAGGILLAILFMLLPTAWIGMKGILTEPMYLALTLLALWVFARHLEEGDAGLGHWVAFGLLMAAACLTRTAGVAFVAAYAAHAGLRALNPRSAASHVHVLVPMAITAGLIAAWLALRPEAPIDGYRQTAGTMLAAWLADPGRMLAVAGASLLDGWINSFLAQGDLPRVPRVALALLGALGIAGSILRAMRNHLDGWYVLATLGMLLAWVFAQENMRRLLYPVVPLLLAHAAWAVVDACRRLGRPRIAPAAVGVGAAFVAALAIPALLLVAQKARDREPFAGGRASPADITDYYRVLGVQQARALAAKHAAVIDGLEGLQRSTPPQARVMWVRPEYVALLGKRAGVAYEYAWDERALARAVRDSRAGYLVATGLYKSDLWHEVGDAFAIARLAAPYADPVLTIRNAVGGWEEFVLLEVDRGRLEALLAR